ncbi:unnamed protein product [Hermetia illucens]|uniref:Uncharacterized protein n=1 Tax=Hermetia illucens TaxID=343691 RepID=A0A7R8UZD2_HERIL|nr:uncharacterized protein LOC119657947 [Hermetia illucens]XP_037921067.1 uncharacterized protein LOC119657947 [Hermetia illucens]CAD7089944.1 unnamed protein product [Hermetia illucens]
MANSPKVTSSSRFVIEDSIPKATSDGEPHEVMTIVAMLSGLIAAAIVLFILFSLIGNRRRSPNGIEPSDSETADKDSKSESTIIPIFSATAKCDELDKSHPQLLSFSTISELVSRNEGLVNSSFERCPSDVCSSLNAVTLSGISTIQC